MALKKTATEKYGVDWQLTSSDEAGRIWSHDRIQIILLQEIRDELQQLNALLHCQNFLTLPRELRGLRRDLKKHVKERS